MMPTAANMAWSTEAVGGRGWHVSWHMSRSLTRHDQKQYSAVIYLYVCSQETNRPLFSSLFLYKMLRASLCWPKMEWLSNFEFLTKWRTLRLNILQELPEIKQNPIVWFLCLWSLSMSKSEMAASAKDTANNALCSPLLKLASCQCRTGPNWGDLRSSLAPC